VNSTELNECPLPSSNLAPVLDICDDNDEVVIEFTPVQDEHDGEE